MGRIVGAFAMSHVMFGPKGVEDQAERILRGMLEVRSRFRELKADRLILVGGDHFNNFDLSLQVPMAVAISDCFTTLGDGGVPVRSFVGDRSFAEGFAAFAAENDFDLAQAEEVVPDHGMAFPKLVLDPTSAVPTVLVFINSAMPLPPSPRRCHELGAVLRDFVTSQRPADERIVVAGLGGLSHWLRMPGEGRIAEEFDRQFLATLAQGGGQGFAASYTSAEILEASGNGGLELLSWLVAAAASNDAPAECLFYEPVVPWITGMAAVVFASPESA